MTATVRLDPETDALLRRLAQKRGCTASEVIRQGIRALAASEPPTVRPYRAVKHLIGCVRSGRSDLSERTGDRFYELLVSKRRQR